MDRQLPAILRRRRWFGGKSKRIRSAGVAETLAVPEPGTGASAGLFLLVRVTYAEGEPETYGVPIVARPEQGPPPERGVLARVESAEGRWLLLDGLGDAAFDEALLSAIERRRRIRGPVSEGGRCENRQDLPRRLHGCW